MLLTATAGRPQCCLFFAGVAAGGVRRRPGARAPARHQVESVPPARWVVNRRLAPTKTEGEAIVMRLTLPRS